VTCRGPQIWEGVQKVAAILPAAKQELELLPPFKPLFGGIQDLFTKMNFADELCTNIEVARWCADQGLIQQGLTILREAMVNAVIEYVLQCPDMLNDRACRQKAECILNNDECERAGELLAGRSYDIDLQKLQKLWRQITEYRNDINHAGWAQHNKHDLRDFRDKLQALALDVRQLVCQAENEIGERQKNSARSV